MYSLLCDQYKSWNPLKRNNKDDIIDPQGYVEEVMINYAHFIPHQIFSLEDSVGASHSGDLEMSI
jgi:hypothetical protein